MDTVIENNRIIWIFVNYLKKSSYDIIWNISFIQSKIIFLNRFVVPGISLFIRFTRSKYLTKESFLLDLSIRNWLFSFGWHGWFKILLFAIAHILSMFIECHLMGFMHFCQGHSWIDILLVFHLRLLDRLLMLGSTQELVVHIYN